MPMIPGRSPGATEGYEAPDGRAGRAGRPGLSRVRHGAPRESGTAAFGGIHGRSIEAIVGALACTTQASPRAAAGGGRLARRGGLEDLADPSRGADRGP